MTAADTFLRELQTIPGIGRSLSQDLLDIGIRRVSDLKGCDPERLYQKLERLRGRHIDRCVLYTFRCAVYFATKKKHDPKLLKWWNWKEDMTGMIATTAASGERGSPGGTRSGPTRGTMWACPSCGHRFLRPNRTHSCGTYRTTDHFAKASQATRDLFKAFTAHVRALGPVTVYAQKTGIIFHLRYRFAVAVVRRDRIDIALCLWKRRKHRALRKVEYFGGRCHRHWFQISQVSDMDYAFLRLLDESREVGS